MIISVIKLTIPREFGFFIKSISFHYLENLNAISCR
nr:MAG TPA_asm: hypothetical protein [Caudoviricetes sp.]